MRIWKQIEPFFNPDLPVDASTLVGDLVKKKNLKRRLLEKNKSASIRYPTSPNPSTLSPRLTQPQGGKQVWNYEKVPRREENKEGSGHKSRDHPRVSVEHLPHSELEWWGGRAPIKTVGARPKCCCPHRTWRLERRSLKCGPTLPESSPVSLSKACRLPPQTILWHLFSPHLSTPAERSAVPSSSSQGCTKVPVSVSVLGWFRAVILFVVTPFFKN